MSQQTALDRLRVLVDAGIALSSELSLDALLQQLVETAAQLTGHSMRRSGSSIVRARGWNGSSRLASIPRHMPRSATSREDGASWECSSATLVPLRLHELGDDPRSVGFPAHHPPMKSFLGVPILLRGVAYGNLYLTEKIGEGDFTDEDEELTQLLGRSGRRGDREHAAVRDVDAVAAPLRVDERDRNALAAELELEPLLGLVARRLRTLIQARLVLIALPEAGAEGSSDQGSRWRRFRCIRPRGDGARTRRFEDGSRTPTRAK